MSKGKNELYYSKDIIYDDLDDNCSDLIPPEILIKTEKEYKEDLSKHKEEFNRSNSIRMIVDESIELVSEEQYSYIKLMFGLDSFKVLNLRDIWIMSNKEMSMIEIAHIILDAMTLIRNAYPNLFKNNIDLINNTINKYFKNRNMIKVNLDKTKEEKYLIMYKELFALYFLCIVYDCEFIDYDISKNTFIKH